MKIEIIQEDPLNILKSTKLVVENSKFVTIDEKGILEISQKIQERFVQGIGAEEMGYTITDSMDNDIQLLFIEDAINFCYWPSKNEPKWQVEQINGTPTEGGWFGLQRCFERAVSEGIPLLDANYIKSISEKDAKYIFRGCNGVEIPLLKERINNLKEAGSVLIEKFKGRFINAAEQAGYDAIKLTNIIIDNFPSFYDVSNFSGKKAYFLKRAQILSSDLYYILKGTNKTLSNLDKLTAFADYKLPQILRMFGAIVYSKELSERVDNYIEIPHDSQEEIEIRAATIWTVELIRQKLKSITARDIDNTIWLLSQGLQKDAKPYHRTRTIFY